MFDSENCDIFKDLFLKSKSFGQMIKMIIFKRFFVGVYMLSVSSHF